MSNFRGGVAPVAGLIFVLAACGGASRDDSATVAGPESAGGGAGASDRETSAGAAGRVVVNGEPRPCTTDDGRDGIEVDTLPKPPAVPRCEAIEQPGELDESCPPEPLMRCGRSDCVGQGDLPGCCRPEGVCGVLDGGTWSAVHSLGCISREPWIEEARWLGSAREAVRCEP